MNYLTDFMTMKGPAFWKKVDAEGAQSKQTFQKLWDKVGEQPLTQEEACSCLDALFIYTHMRLKAMKLDKVYPTKQFTRHGLEADPYLWWVDHFTAGISGASTLNWFSAAQVKKKNGSTGLAGASTHFVMDFHGEPYYIIPLMHGAWHEPHRNADSISIETVNPGALTQDGHTWRFWAREVPPEVIKELPPVLLDKPYRGAKILLPFTRDQLIANIKLKRVIDAALPGKLELPRMSQHSDWREGKTDMGPLWPLTEINQAAFSTDPVLELSFIQHYEEEQDEVGTIIHDIYDEDDSPEYGSGTPTHPDDSDTTPRLLSVTELQTLLDKKGYPLKVDGKFGSKTQTAVRAFQADWNKTHKDAQLKVDGIPGAQTCACLQK